MTAAPLIEIAGLQAGYGASQILFDVNLSVAPGEVVALLGRNGMGKTTTIKALMGLIPVRGGQVRVGGETVAGLPANRIARLGIGLVPEGRRIFRNLSVKENLIATSRPAATAAGWTLDAVYRLFPRLQERAGNLGGKLSGGEQQMLAIGRALMTNPRLLILDEATEGLAPIVRTLIWTALGDLKQRGQAILVVDKNLGALHALADRYEIIEKGRTVWTGAPADLIAAEDARNRYLGV